MRIKKNFTSNTDIRNSCVSLGHSDLKVSKIKQTKYGDVHMTPFSRFYYLKNPKHGS